MLELFYPNCLVMNLVVVNGLFGKGAKHQNMSRLSRFQKWVKHLVSLLLVLIVVLPYGSFFHGGEGLDGLRWSNSFIFFDWLMLVPVFLSMLLWYFYLRARKGSNLRIFTGVSLLVIALLFAFYAIISLVVPAPDYMPGIGLLPLFLLLPVLLCYFVLQYLMNRTSAS